ITTPILLPISAKTPDALKQLAGRYAGLLATPDHAALSDICFSAATRRGHHEYRLALVTSGDEAQLTTRLSDISSGGVAEDAAIGRALQTADVNPVFVFTGMGPQWWAMGQQLLAEDDLFRATLEKMDAIFQRLSGWSLVQQM